MPATEEKTLNQTLREVIGENVSSAGKTDEGKAQGDSGETQSGGTPEYISGIDISGLPEQERTVARKVLSEKGKLLEDGYQKKFSEVAGYKRERDELLKMGLSQEEAGKVLREHVLRKTDASSATDAKKTAVRIIDQLKDQAPDLGSRKGLDNLEKIILELTNISDINKKIEQLEKAVGYVQNREFQSREQSLNKALDSLSEKYGENVIKKYREEVIKQGLAFPDADPRRLLNAIADPDDLEQAILSNKTKKEDRQKEKINAISSATSGMTGAKEHVDIKKTSIKSLLSDLMVAKK